MTDKPIALEDRDIDGAKMFSPSAGRNKAVIAHWLAEHLPQGANVLEIGSGTGEHGAALGELRRDVIWHYSDPDAQSRDSQRAWAREGWPEPRLIDVTQDGWWDGLPSVDAIFSANMIHIAPWAAAVGLADGAEHLAEQVILYGPFLLGEDSAPSNLDFDASLKSRDADWGVRELQTVKDMFAMKGFNAVERFDMPKNNLIVRLSKS